jgi:hypothetical protein
MTTALATTSNQTRALARFGSEEEIKLLMTRQAAIFGVPQADINRPDVQASLIKATQYSINYGYLPGIHIHMIPFRKNDKQGGRDNWIDTYVPDLGEKAWKDSADRLAQMQGFKYLVETKEMTQAEIKAATAADPTSEYSEDDAGFKARVLRSDHAEIYKMMGQAYNPEWSYGFWRKKAKKKSNGEWLTDTVPTQRSPRDVAERRATKAALMKVFTLVPLNDFEDSRRFRSLTTYVETETAVDDVLIAQPQATHYDDDGLLMWGEATDGQYRTVDTDTGEVQFMQAPPVTPVTPTNGNGHTNGKRNPVADMPERIAPSELPHSRLEPHESLGNGHKTPTEAPATDVDMVSQVQLKALHAAGTDLYGKEWDTKRPQLVKGATKARGTFTSANELTKAEADKLIQGMRDRIAKRNFDAEHSDVQPQEQPAEDGALWQPELVTA